MLTLPADKDSIVRFFYQPVPGTYLHVALIFRVVDNKDPRLNTAPVFDEGRTAYISLSDMQRLIGGLSRLRVSWEVSPKMESLETYKTSRLCGIMVVKVLSPRGTAKAAIVPAKICETVAQLDAALQTPRALWEFQLFRLQYDCRVPNFNPKAYPDRIP